jgi:hypothetical protein
MPPRIFPPDPSGVGTGLRTNAPYQVPWNVPQTQMPSPVSPITSKVPPSNFQYPNNVWLPASTIQSQQHLQRIRTLPHGMFSPPIPPKPPFQEPPIPPNFLKQILPPDLPPKIPLVLLEPKSSPKYTNTPTGEIPPTASESEDKLALQEEADLAEAIRQSMAFREAEESLRKWNSPQHSSPQHSDSPQPSRPQDEEDVFSTAFASHGRSSVPDIASVAHADEADHTRSSPQPSGVTTDEALAREIQAIENEPDDDETEQENLGLPLYGEVVGDTTSSPNQTQLSQPQVVPQAPSQISPQTFPSALPPAPRASTLPAMRMPVPSTTFSSSLQTTPAGPSGPQEPALPSTSSNTQVPSSNTQVGTSSSSSAFPLDVKVPLVFLSPGGTSNPPQDMAAGPSTRPIGDTTSEPTQSVTPVAHQFVEPSFLVGVCE